MASSVAFIAGQIPHSRLESLHVVYLSTSDAFLFLNNGNVELHVQQVDFRCQSLDHSETKAVNASVAPGAFLIHRLFRGSGVVSFHPQDHPTLQELRARAWTALREYPATARIHYVAGDNGAKGVVDFLDVLCIQHDAAAK